MWKSKRISRPFKGPVILPRAIKEFQNRTLNSYRWVKLVPKRELLKDADYFSQNGFKFHTDPWKHQAACFTIAAAVKQFLFFLDTGSGKSKIVLDAVQYLKLTEGLGRTLVLLLSETNAPTWIEQVQEHRPELKVVELFGPKAVRLEDLENGLDGDIFLLNYEGLMPFMTTLVQNKGRQIDRKMAQDFASLFDALVMDESHCVGNKQSLRFRLCNYLSRFAQVRFALSASPFGRNPERLWSQFFLVDHGETLGTSLGMYRSCFFKGEQNYWGGMEWHFDQRKASLLHKTLNNRSISYDDAEFTDMPKEPVRVRHPVTFGMDVEDYYQKQLHEFRTKPEERRNTFLRMRQACSGFLSVGDPGEQKDLIAFATNPKLEALLALLQSLPDWDKVIVYHEFIFGGDMIAERLKEAHIKFVRAGGGSSSRKAMVAFQDNPKVRLLLANNHSGATTGVNPHKVCRRICFFDTPSSPVIRKQAEGRIRPRLNAKHCYIHDLVVVNSVDEMVLQWVKEGEDLFAAIVAGKEMKL